MEKLSEAASRVVIARPRRGRGNLGKALPEWERHRRPYTLPGLTVAALSERHWQLQISVYPADRTGHQICHCEEAAGQRGNLGKALPEWERHRRPYTLPGLTVAALSERHWQLQISVYPADRTGHQICHCEEAVGRRGNLGKALAVRTSRR